MSTMHRRLRSRGVSLIELLVALTIGIVIVLGATQVYVDSRNAYGVNETASRLQESARFAISVIEPDIRLANYWGLVKGFQWVEGRALQTDAAAAVASGDDTNICGTNFAVDLSRNIQGDNNSFTLSGSRTSECNGYNSQPVASADTLTVRRAASTTSVAADNTLQICSTRTMAYLFSDGATTCPAAPEGRINDLSVNAYYIARDSEGQTGVPSLRRYSLQPGGANEPTFEDLEIISGIEDMQVQFGIDTTGSTGNGVQRYINPGAAVPANSQIVAVRIWLLIRSDSPELGFVDGNVYEYGDRSSANGYTSDLTDVNAASKAYRPTDAGDELASVKHYRRLLVSRTIQIRNALGT